jgi:hypothetical protein
MSLVTAQQEHPVWIQLDLLKSQRVGTISVIFGAAAASKYDVLGDDQAAPGTFQQLVRHDDERCAVAGRSDRHALMRLLRIIRIELLRGCGDNLEIAEVEITPAEAAECRLPRNCVVGIAEAVRVAGGIAGSASTSMCETAWQEATEQLAVTDACAGADIDQGGPTNSLADGAVGVHAFTSASFVNCRYEVFNAFPSYYLCSPP